MAWLPPDTQTISTALHEGPGVVDTDVLLGLYRYDQDGTQQWLDILRTFGERLFLPHQVMLEFWKHRATVASSPKDTPSADATITQAARAPAPTYESWASSGGKDLNPAQTGLLAELGLLTERTGGGR